MRTLIKAGLRIFSVFVFLQLIAFEASYFVVFSAGTPLNRVPGLITMALVFVLETALLLFIWVKADKVVDIIAGSADEKSLALNVSGAEVTAILLRAFGIYFILRAIPAILGLVVYQVGMNSDSGFRHSFSASDAQQWTVQVVTLLIGIALVLGSGKVKRAGTAIGNFWKYGNSAGPEPDSFSEDQTGH
jgi:hypothetical protein